MCVFGCVIEVAFVCAMCKQTDTPHTHTRQRNILLTYRLQHRSGVCRISIHDCPPPPPLPSFSLSHVSDIFSLTISERSLPNISQSMPPSLSPPSPNDSLFNQTRGSSSSSSKGSRSTITYGQVCLMCSLEASVPNVYSIKH